MKHLECKQQKISLPYSYYLEIQQELLSALPARIQSLTNSLRVVRTASTILKLNLLESALLAWLLRNSHYSLFDLSVSASKISLFQQEDINKQLLLYLLLNAYYVKNFLSNDATPEIDAQVLALLPNFKTIYTAWRPDSKLQNVSLGQLNTVFSRWSQPQKRKKLDYNHLVNRILQLSKTYNVGNQQQPPLKKKRKLNEIQKDKESSHSIKSSKLISYSNVMMIQSSRNKPCLQSDVYKPQHHDIWHYESDELPIRRSTRRSGIIFDLGESRRFNPLRVSRSIVDSSRMNRQISSSQIKMTNSIQKG